MVNSEREFKMKAEIKKAASLLSTGTTATKNKSQNETYPKADLLSRRQAKIEKRLADIPPAYKKIYKKAIDGKSLRACINAQCLECCGYQRNEIALCTCFACSLWIVRPYSQNNQNRCNEPFFGAESKNNERGYIG